MNCYLYDCLPLYIRLPGTKFRLKSTIHRSTLLKTNISDITPVEA